MSTTDRDTELSAWIPLTIFGGMIPAFVLVKVADNPPMPVVLLLLGLALMGTGGYYAQRGRLRAAAQPVTRGLVGSRISHGGSVFTILDDSAVNGSGRRASVVASDETGQAGLIFLGFDGDGSVSEARLPDGAWGPARVVG